MVETTKTTSPTTAQDKACGRLDFIHEYVRYADVLEAPPIMHEAVAEQLIAATLNRSGVKIQLGGLMSPLDLWQALLSGSGLGRTTLVGIADPIIEMAGLNDIVLNARWGSPQALYQQMADRPSGLFIWGELSERLKLLNEPRFGGAKQWITDLYDNWKVPESITYRQTRKKSRDTPPIRFESAPRINILATSSEEWFFNNLVEGDSAGGFVPRWMLIRVKDSRRVVPIPKESDPARVKPLAEHLQCVSQLKGYVDLSEVLNLYEKWYRDAKQRFESQPNQALARAYFSRHRGHILKLATIYEVSSSLSLRVSPPSWGRAVGSAKQAEETIFSLLGTGMSREGFAVSKMEEAIRLAGANGLPLHKFTRAFQHDVPRERIQRLRTLLDGEILHAYVGNTTGRPRRTLVHSDFVSNYPANHPDHRRVSSDFLKGMW